MKTTEAMAYAERLYPLESENVRMMLAIAYMDGCIDTNRKMTKDMEMERLVKEERDERMRYDAMDIQKEMRCHE